MREVRNYPVPERIIIYFLDELWMKSLEIQNPLSGKGSIWLMLSPRLRRIVGLFRSFHVRTWSYEHVEGTRSKIIEFGG